MTIKRKLSTGLFCILPFLCVSPPAQAHPHIWIKASAALVFEDGKVVGIRHEWVFDAFFSNAIISDFDKNKNKQFDPAEIPTLKKDAFEGLAEFSYFTHAKADGKALKIKGARDFSAEIRKEAVVYRFIALLAEPLDPAKAAFSAGVYDHTYYVDVEFVASGAVTLAGPGSEACKVALVEDRGNPLYFGAVYPKRIDLRCGKN
jgi:ABC-type uncharacterized transport system substrate-binding protein